mgnify:CR=1 FL=1|jgi:hypothetical protein
MDKYRHKGNLLSIVAVIGGIVLNFEKFAWGSSPNAKNLIVTLAYLAIWVFVIIMSTKSKGSKMLKYCLSFWVLVFFFSVLTAYINVTEALADWAIPFVIIFLGPLDGIRFFVHDFLILSIIIAVISFGISVASALLIKNKLKS